MTDVRLSGVEYAQTLATMAKGGLQKKDVDLNLEILRSKDPERYNEVLSFLRSPQGKDSMNAIAKSLGIKTDELSIRKLGYASIDPSKIVENIRQETSNAGMLQQHTIDASASQELANEPQKASTFIQSGL